MSARWATNTRRPVAELVAPTSVELSEIRQRVEKSVAGGSSALVKVLIQALIHEIRVDGRQAIHPVFRVPLGGNHLVDDAVRAPSGSDLYPKKWTTYRTIWP